MNNDDSRELILQLLVQDYVEGLGQDWEHRTGNPEIADTLAAQNRIVENYLNPPSPVHEMAGYFYPFEPYSHEPNSHEPYNHEPYNPGPYNPGSHRSGPYSPEPYNPGSYSPEPYSPGWARHEANMMVYPPSQSHLLGRGGYYPGPTGGIYETRPSTMDYATMDRPVARTPDNGGGHAYQMQQPLKRPVGEGAGTRTAETAPERCFLERPAAKVQILLFLAAVVMMFHRSQLCISSAQRNSASSMQETRSVEEKAPAARIPSAPNRSQTPRSSRIWPSVQRAGQELISPVAPSPTQIKVARRIPGSKRSWNWPKPSTGGDVINAGQWSSV
ncbi:hypothetical protein BDV25DRAFT_135143 [Aspergillus avenaceus]|uniref:Uncharacterized protein n=1 Tax=Aspergillus avenaceus TaxID=36643 RepID=A0A5N6U937_ASPAV|nr:hypothetical protein BDV25DRAFT_135143 [Aspergillus avenaceus]